VDLVDRVDARRRGAATPRGGRPQREAILDWRGVLDWHTMLLMD